MDDYKKFPKRGEIWYCDLGQNVGREQNGIRPVLIVQNDTGNKYSETTIVVPITSKTKTKIPTHTLIEQSELVGTGLSKPSIILSEQVKVVDKARLLSRVGEVSLGIMNKVNISMLISFSIQYSTQHIVA